MVAYPGAPRRRPRTDGDNVMYRTVCTYGRQTVDPQRPDVGNQHSGADSRVRMYIHMRNGREKFLDDGDDDLGDQPQPTWSFGADRCSTERSNNS